jgi:alkylation response protein AidB-like acyl-CoA dehydrogenase
MGWRSQPTASVHLDKVFVPSEALVGKQGQGFKIAMHALDGGRINIAACRWVGGLVGVEGMYVQAEEGSGEKEGVCAE